MNANNIKKFFVSADFLACVLVALPVALYVVVFGIIPMEYTPVPEAAEVTETVCTPGISFVDLK